MSAVAAKKAGAKPGEEKKPRRRVKKVAGHGGHHGGAWKVAYADFVTAMMALFLVLWLLSQADTKLKEAIANYFRAPGAFTTLRGGILDGPRKASKDPSSLTSKDEEKAFLSAAISLRRQFSSRPEFAAYKDQIKVDVTAEGLRIQIIDKADKVSFSSGSAELTASTKTILAEIARGVCQLPNPITIGGHTDRKPFENGSAYTNWELSADRANAARRALEAECVKPAQIRRVVGYADTELLVPDDPFAAANRRISITVLRLAGTAEGKSLAPLLIEKEGEGEDEAKPKKPRASEESEEDDAQEPEKKPEKKAEKAEKPAVESRPSAAKHAGDEAEGGSAEARAAKAKLRARGSVSVGTPDELPSKARRVRE
jgi:chemotaxis protein MotB